MPDHFYSAKRTLERAKYHFRDFEARITALGDGKQATYLIERDRKGRDNRHKIKFDKTFFEEAPSVVFDCLNNLRATLDHCIYASCVAARGPGDYQFTAFVFCEDREFLANRINGASKDAPEEIQALIPAFKPHKGGSTALWSLHRLCNLRKHALLMPIATEGLQVHSGPLIIGLKHKWVPENHEIEITDSGGADFSHADGFVFRIAFDDTESWVKRSDPLAVLEAMISEVQGVLVRIEAECWKLWPRAFD
jgi:hypothetical protein